MRLDRRIDSPEAKPGADYAEVVEWGPGHEHFPTMTKGELKKMLEDTRNLLAWCRDPATSATMPQE
jgi:trehalose utilization protein